MAPRVSALIVAYNTRQLTLEALASVAGDADIELIVVDNNSADGTADAVAAGFPEATLVRSAENRGFAWGVNRAVERATGEYLLLLNPDAALSPGSLGTMLAFLDAHPTAAAVGPRLAYGDGSHQDSAFRFPGLLQVWLDLFPINRLMAGPLNGRYTIGAEPLKVDFLLGACALIRREAWERVGPLDERFFMYVEEVDWFRRAQQAGWEVWHHPVAVAVHHAGQSTRQKADVMFVELWHSRLKYYAKHFPGWYAALVKAVLRLGLRRQADRARRELTGEALESRLGALRQIRALAR
jgi:GT2 family glycosyltransferase